MARTGRELKSLGGNFNEAGAKSAGKRIGIVRQAWRFCITDFNEAGAKSAGKQAHSDPSTRSASPREDFNEAGAKSAGKLARYSRSLHGRPDLAASMRPAQKAPENSRGKGAPDLTVRKPLQ